MNRLADKVAPLTSAAQGLGATYAKALAAEGAKVMVSDFDDPSRVVSEIKASDGTAAGIVADVTDDASIASVADATEKEFGPVEILVNSAALFAALRLTPITEISNEAWDKTMTVNARGTFQCIKAVVPSMLKNGRGKVINVSSGNFYYGGPGMAGYVSSKGAVLGLTRSAAREFGDQNIHVNAIVPGLTIGEGVDTHPQLGVAREPTVASRILKREMMPKDLVGTLLFLASEDSDFLSGQSINVDGGRFCQ